MSIDISKCYLVRQSGKAVEPEYMDWEKKDIEEYLKNNPMPTDEKYSQDDMIYDLTESEGALTFSDDLKPETIDYLSALINWLIYECGGGQ